MRFTPATTLMLAVGAALILAAPAQADEKPRNRGSDSIWLDLGHPIRDLPAPPPGDPAAKPGSSATVDPGRPRANYGTGGMPSTGPNALTLKPSRKPKSLKLK